MIRTLKILLILILLCLILAYAFSDSDEVKDYLLISGGLLLFVFLVTIIAGYGKRKGHNKILRSKGKDIVRETNEGKDSKPTSDAIAFESKYRERKSGMSWNRESLHSANSTRGSYRKFLRSFKK